MNSSENFSISDYSVDDENDDGEGIEKVLQFWIEGVLTPVISLLGVLGTQYTYLSITFENICWSKSDIYLLQVVLSHWDWLNL